MSFVCRERREEMLHWSVSWTMTSKWTKYAASDGDGDDVDRFVVCLKLIFRPWLGGAMQQIRVNANLSASGDGESRRRFPGIPHFTNIIQSIPALYTSPPSRRQWREMSMRSSPSHFTKLVWWNTCFHFNLTPFISLALFASGVWGFKIFTIYLKHQCNGPLVCW